MGVYITARDAPETDTGYFVTKPVTSLHVSIEGIVGDRHGGFTRIVYNRSASLYNRSGVAPGTNVRNNRQWSAISPDELDMISDILSPDFGRETRVTPEMIGANFLIDGIQNLTQLPGLTYLVLSPHERFESGRPEDSVLVVYGQARPCEVAGRAVASAHGSLHNASRFVKASMGHRGIVGWVESPAGRKNVIQPNYTVHVLQPNGID